MPESNYDATQQFLDFCREQQVSSFVYRVIHGGRTRERTIEIEQCEESQGKKILVYGTEEATYSNGILQVKSGNMVEQAIAIL
jgi:hypothetical protein